MKGKTDMTGIEVVGLGAMNMDHLYTVERVLPDGESAIGGLELQPGGSAANTICGLARLGLKCGFIGAVGEDEPGRKLIAALAQAGVDTSCLRVKSEAVTGTVLCFSAGRGGRSLYVSPGANGALTMQDVDLDYAGQARLLHMSSFVHDEQLAVQEKVLAALPPEVKVSFAPGALYTSRGFRRMAPLLARTGALFVNESELRRLTRKDARAGAERCLAEGCGMVVVTSGKGKIRLAAGEERQAVCYIRYCEQAHGDGECLLAPSPVPAEVVDTTGAGDAFAAGFLYGLLRGRGLAECAVLGDLTARFCIARKGARAGLPSARQLDDAHRRRIAES